jgi:hypothetical protein
MGWWTVVAQSAPSFDLVAELARSVAGAGAGGVALAFVLVLTERLYTRPHVLHLVEERDRERDRIEKLIESIDSLDESIKALVTLQREQHADEMRRSSR